MRIFSIFLFLFFLFHPAYAFAAPQVEVKLVFKNNAGYPIPHMSITRINEEPGVDILEKPLAQGEMLDVFIKSDGKTTLLLWLIDDNFDRLAIEIGNTFKNIEYIEIQNNAALKFVMRETKAGDLVKPNSK